MRKNLRTALVSSVEEACRRLIQASFDGGDALGHVALDGVGRVRLVAMDQKKLDMLVLLLVRRARKVSASAKMLHLEAEDRDWMPVTLTDEERVGPCVLLSVDDDGASLKATEIAKAMWYGLVEQDPGENALAWVYQLVRSAGGHVSVERKTSGGNRVRCFLPAVPEA